MDLGGAENLIMNLYRHIDRSVVQFDFLLHCPTESFYEKEILSLGGNIFRIPRYLGYNKVSYERRLTDFLKTHPEHIIIHDHLMDSATETLRVAKRLGRIAVAHSHTASSSFSPSDAYRFFFRRNLWKVADYRLACSEAAGKWLYRGKTDFIVLRNGIDTKLFRFSDKCRSDIRREFGLSESTKVIGTVGRMVKEKNQMRLLSLMRALSEMGSDCSLLMVGEGPLENKLKTTSKKLGLEDRIVFSGPRSDVNELMSAMDVFVLPSLVEGLGIVLVEAQASGLPCIFTDSIPKEVDLIPNLIHRTSLSSSDSVWAKAILESEPFIERDKAWEAVADKGYDISTSSKQLKDFYVSAMERRCASV